MKVRQKAYNAKKVIKYDDYHLEAARRNALLLPFIVDSNGSFTPTDKLFNPGITNRRPPRGAGIDPRLGLIYVLCSRTAWYRRLGNWKSLLKKDESSSSAAG